MQHFSLAVVWKRHLYLLVLHVVVGILNNLVLFGVQVNSFNYAIHTALLPKFASFGIFIYGEMESYGFY